MLKCHVRRHQFDGRSGSCENGAVNRRLLQIAGCIGFLYLSISGVLSYTNKPWYDEAVHAGPAWDLVTRGRLGFPISDPNFSDRYCCAHDRMYQTMPLSHLGPAAWFELVGFGVYRMRMYAMLWGLLALGCWVFIAKTLTNSWSPALLTALFLVADRAFEDSASSGRPDMMCAGLASMGLASYLYLRERNLGAAVFVSQVFLAAALFTHPVGALAEVALVIVAIRLDFRRFEWRYLWIAAAPFAMGFALWGWYIAQDPANFRLQFMANAEGRGNGILHPIQSLVNEIRGRYGERMYLPPYATGLRKLTVLIPILYAIAVIGLLFRRREARLLGAIALAYFLVFGILEPKKYSFYLVHVTMVLACGLAVWVWSEWQEGGSRRWAAASVAGLLVVLQLGWIGYTCLQDTNHRYYIPAMAYLDRHAGPHALIMAESEVAFHRGFYSGLVDDATLGYFSGKRPDFIVMSFDGWPESIKGYRETHPDLWRYASKMLRDDYRKVYEDRIYLIYQRLPTGAASVKRSS